MLRVIWNQESLAGRLSRFAAIFALAGVVVSCSSEEKSTTDKPAQKTFDSPSSAGVALYTAAKSGSPDSLLAIFGADSRDVLFSGDGRKDKDYLQYFVSAYDKMHRWRDINAGGEVLDIGADNYSFPIPLGQNPSGQWYFDTAAGRDEILARRIGKDELTAITACVAILDAEKQYYSQTRNGDTVKQYSQKFISDEGKQDGLYWPVSSAFRGRNGGLISANGSGAQCARIIVLTAMRGTIFRTTRPARAPIVAEKTVWRAFLTTSSGSVLHWRSGTTATPFLKNACSG